MVEAQPWARLAWLDELHDSAPLRDLVRPGEPARAMVVQPLAACAGVLRVVRVTAALLMLADQCRREAVTALLLDTDGWRVVSLPVDARASLASMQHGVQSALQADPMLLASDVALNGTVIDVRPCPGDPAVQADLVIHLPDTGAGTLAIDTQVYLPQTQDVLIRQYAHHLAALLSDPGASVGHARQLDGAERHRLLHGFNARRVAAPRQQTLDRLIGAGLRARPDAVVAVHGSRHLTGAQLDAQANRLANLLVGLGVSRGQFVAIVDQRGLDFLVAMVAIWKAGAAYIPVDPGYPEDRVRYMLSDSQTRVAIVGASALQRHRGILDDCERLADVVCPQAIDIVTGLRCRLHDHAALGACPDLAIAPRATACDPAYMVYTSGSTGRPKGAIVRHDGAVNHLYAQADALTGEAIGRFLQSAPSSSDISVWQFMAPLVFGGTTVIVDDPTDVAELMASVRQHGVHLIELVPSVLRYLIAYAQGLPPLQRALPSLRWAMVTGESAPVDLVNGWLALYPDIPVVNAYGPTEAADDVCQAIVRQPLHPRLATVPIGQPLANMDLYVLDDQLQPVPVGAPGEICIAGIGVGDGYWQQPDKTRQAFVPNPFAGAQGPTLYRTGDLGRWRDDGSLECLGRLDHQVKVRGHRIELQEIEAVLRSHAAVSDAVVKAFRDERGDGTLAAYVVPVSGHDADDDALRAHLAARLPAYMVPAAIVQLHELPLNPAGKVDRNALTRPEPRTPEGSGNASAARTPTERVLLAAWRAELGAPSIGIDDDFFALGGDSLAALAISVAAHQAGLVVRSADVLAHPSVARLSAELQRRDARLAAAGSPATPPAQAITPLPETQRQQFLSRETQCEDVRPLDPPQRGLYLHGLLSRDKTVYIDQYAYDLVGALDAAALQAAWQHVVARHPALRTGFLRRALAQPVQAVWREVDLPLQHTDLSQLQGPEQQPELDRLQAQQRAAAFDLARPPLMRLLLVRLANDRHRLVWTHHHLVVDGWSMTHVLQEVLSCYAALRQGGAPDMPPAPPSPQAWADWLATHDLAPGLAFWRQALQGYDGAPDWTLAAPANRRAGFGHASVELNPALVGRLAGRAVSAGVTTTTLLQAAWALLLGHSTGRHDVVFGVVTSGREIDAPDIGRRVGLFVTTLPLRLDLARRDGEAMDQWLRGVQQRAALQRQHEDVPLGQIIKASDLPTGRSLFDTLFVMSNYPALQPVPGSGLDVAPADFVTQPAYPLSLVVMPGPTWTLRLVHDRMSFDEQGASQVLARYQALLALLADGADPRTTGEP